MDCGKFWKITANECRSSTALGRCCWKRSGVYRGGISCLCGLTEAWYIWPQEGVLWRLWAPYVGWGWTFSLWWWFRRHVELGYFWYLPWGNWLIGCETCIEDSRANKCRLNDLNFMENEFATANLYCQVLYTY